MGEIVSVRLSLCPYYIFPELLHNISIRNWKNIALDRSLDGGAVLSRPRPTLGCSANDDDDDGITERISI
jgi:hypothetical protein